MQTAVGAGTLIVGIGMQVEQCTNLDNVANSGAAIRIPKRQWTPEKIRQAVSRVLEVPSYGKAQPVSNPSTIAFTGVTKLPGRFGIS